MQKNRIATLCTLLVLTFTRGWSIEISEKEYERLKQKEELLHTQALPILSVLLKDKNYSSQAGRIMSEIDEARTAQYVYDLLPKGDHNVHKLLLRRSCHSYERGTGVEWSDLAYRGAKVYLGSKEIAEGFQSVSASNTIDAIKLVSYYGNAGDMELLRSYLTPTIEAYEEQIISASEAALARLGDEYYLNKIESELKSFEEIQELTIQDKYRLEKTLRKAGASGNPRYIDYVGPYLYHESESVGDIHIAPVMDAVQALEMIVGKSGVIGWEPKLSHWQSWWKQRISSRDIQ
ncbi:hypothetical protein QEH52_19560 [Coraliomargarita sp. SDUM461003]|uniref:Uncharacterized protein n=1 Tax=Thalassobacterium maritimum TaxID=3041265 RepID=A0ABU1B011_9BACT|nr:hypothetical protein [Coraliomargarita sp. SDUM461003]MDQ8209725.1 hypothetical protein [Coraliomargarita sp. SDUM461003]